MKITIQWQKVVIHTTYIQHISNANCKLSTKHKQTSQNQSTTT